jgi:hypothetical protein
MSTMPPPLASTHPRGWWSRHWKWVVPLLGALMLALFAGVVLLFMSALFGMMKSSDAYQQALRQAKANPAVVQALGEPIEEGWLTMGNISVNGPSGEANLQIPISGPKGEGDIYLEAEKSAGEWTYSTLLIRIDGSDEPIDLLAASPGEAPAP